MEIEDLRLVSLCYTSDMKHMKQAMALLIGVLAGLGGCRSMKVDYSVEVRNNTGGAISAQVMHDFDDRVVQVYSMRVNPQSRGQISLPRRGKEERLLLQVSAPNNPSTPAKMPLAPGMAYVNVSREGEDGPVRLEQVR